MLLAFAFRKSDPEKEGKIAWAMIEDVELLSIIQIARNVSAHGLGMSLENAIEGTDYANLRSQLDPACFISLLRENPDYIADWIMYSEDKRSSGGWYLLEKTKEIGTLEISTSRKRYKTIEEAAANFILKELDSYFESMQKSDRGEPP